MAAETYETGPPPAHQTKETVAKSVVLEEISVFGLWAALNTEEGTWQERALCAQADPEAFFPEKGGSTREAKKVCGNCDVQDECLEYALQNDERFGVWGGLSERERRKLKNQPEDDEEPDSDAPELEDESAQDAEEASTIYTRGGVTLRMVQPESTAGVTYTAAAEHCDLPLAPVVSRPRPPRAVSWTEAAGGVRVTLDDPIQAVSELPPEIDLPDSLYESDVDFDIPVAPREMPEAPMPKQDTRAKGTEPVPPGRVEYCMGDGVWHTTRRQIGTVALLYDEQGLQRMSIEAAAQHLQKSSGYVRSVLREVIGSVS